MTFSVVMGSGRLGRRSVSALVLHVGARRPRSEFDDASVDEAGEPDTEPDTDTDVGGEIVGGDEKGGNLESSRRFTSLPPMKCWPQYGQGAMRGRGLESVGRCDVVGHAHN